MRKIIYVADDVYGFRLLAALPAAADPSLVDLVCLSRHVFRAYCVEITGAIPDRTQTLPPGARIYTTTSPDRFSFISLGDEHVVESFRRRAPGILTRMRLFIGRWRMFWNLCPACNSDAPEIDSCRVCLSNRDFPLSRQVKEMYLLKHYIKVVVNDPANAVRN